MIGLPQEKQYSVKYDLDQFKIPENFNLKLSEVLSKAYGDRPEIHQMNQIKTLNELQLKLAEANYKPNIALVGQYQGVSTDYDPSNWFDAKNRLWTCTLSFTGNIYNGSATRSKVEGARKNVELTEIKETKVRDQIRLEVEQAMQGIVESLETVRANQSNIDLARETLELTQARIEAGMATTMDLMDSQLAVDRALNGYYRGVAMYLTAEARLDLAMGK